jgi:hypothetical protein
MSRVTAVAEIATWYPASAGWTSGARSTARDPERALAFQAALRQATARQDVSARPIPPAPQVRPLNVVADDFSLTELPLWPLGTRTSRPVRPRPALPAAS